MADSGIKQRRTAKHRTKYAAQRLRTAKNKLNRIRRIQRRKQQNPQV